MPCGARPSAPGGVSGVRCDRRAALRRSVGIGYRAAEPFGEPGDVRARPLVAERPDERVVGVVRPLRRGQDVRQRLADVVEVRHAEPADVRQEAGRREPPVGRQRGRRPGRQRRAPSSHQRVRVEQRHRQVADVVRSQLVHLGDDPPDASQPSLRAPARLRRPRRARREQQVAEALRGDPAGRRVRRVDATELRQRGFTGRVVDDDHPVASGRRGAEGAAECPAVDQRELRGRRHEQLALRVGQVAGQLVAAVRRVPTDDDRAGQRGGLQPEDVFRDVVEQHRHVERPRPAPIGQPGGADRGLGDDLGVRVRAVGGRQPRPADRRPGAGPARRRSLARASPERSRLGPRVTSDRRRPAAPYRGAPA